MPPLAAARAANATFSPSYLPVAVFVGGTSGIGKAIAQAFATYTNGRAHIIIVGRNKAAAESVIASFPRPSAPEAKHEFVACDVSLMKNVDAMTASLRERLPKIHFLVMSAGVVGMRGRDETKEGIARCLALDYYARWKLARDLMPLLRQAKDAGEDAKVMSVLAAGSGWPADLDDLGLKNNYSILREARAGPTYNDAMMMSFAEQHPDITFVHIYPGIVRTSIVPKSHCIWRIVYPVLEIVSYPFSFSEEESGEHMLYGLLFSDKGVSRRNSIGDKIGRKGLNVESGEVRRRIWEHTEETIELALVIG